MTQQPAHTARLAAAHIETSAIIANWHIFKAMAPDAEVAGVLKADAYGAGAPAAGKALVRAGCQTFFTATTGEAIELRAAIGPAPTIYALNGPTSDEDARALRDNAITPAINSLEQAARWKAGAKESQKCALHVDTGMNRLGLQLTDVAAARDALGESVTLFMSHLACASLPSHSLNARQRARFREASALFPNARRSLSATAGAQLGPEFRFDVLRVGMGLFGSADRDDGVALNNVATVTAPILQVRDVAEGESMGYGASVVATHTMRVAIAAVGYADGFLRSLAGRGYGVVGGAKRPILGRVSMDLVILDITGDSSIRAGDMAEFLGPNAPLDDVAARAGTNSYEIMTTFVATVRRRGSVA